MFVSAAVLHQLGYKDPYVGSRPIYWIHRTRERNETYEYYVGCGRTNEMKIWSSQLWLKKVSPKTFFGLTFRLLKSSEQLWTQFKQLRIEAWENQGSKPVTSRYRCDALTNWAMKPLTLGTGYLWVLVSLRGHGFKPRWSPDFFRPLYSIAYIAFITAMIIGYLISKLAVQYKTFFIYHFTLTAHVLIKTHKWPAPSVSGFIAQLVRVSHRYLEVTGSNTVEVLVFTGF